MSTDLLQHHLNMTKNSLNNNSLNNTTTNKEDKKKRRKVKKQKSYIESAKSILKERTDKVKQYTTYLSTGSYYY